MSRPLTGPARLAWLVLAYNLFVILWGAFVRASFSGAGCGSSWPTCNGEVLPSLASAETLIEFVHRATSGPALLLVFGLAVWIFRRTERGDPARPAVLAAALFITTEALLGAGLVIFERVAHDSSLSRAGWQAAHLVNTFLLLAALTLAAYYASGGAAPRLRGRRRALGLLLVGALGFLAVGASGAVTALGDTLFPASSHREVLAQGLFALDAAHFLERLRIWHPIASVALLLLLGWIVERLRGEAGAGAAGGLARWLFGLFALQLGLGLLNVWLKAPIWMQLVHLLVADLLWIAYLLFGASVLGAPALREAQDAETTAAARLSAEAADA